MRSFCVISGCLRTAKKIHPPAGIIKLPVLSDKTFFNFGCKTISMNTIENLRAPKEVTRKIKDENGNTTVVTETKMAARIPETVKMGPRFGYFLIDLFFVYLLTFIVGVVLALLGYYDTVDDPIMSRLIATLVFVAYYFLLEVATGASLGKLMLGYTVIDNTAEKPSAVKLLGRSFSRAVPFETFSCLGERGWHDAWPNTYVVKKSEKEDLRRLLGKISSTDILD